MILCIGSDTVVNHQTRCLQLDITVEIHAQGMEGGLAAKIHGIEIYAAVDEQLDTCDQVHSLLRICAEKMKNSFGLFCSRIDDVHAAVDKHFHGIDNRLTIVSFQQQAEGSFAMSILQIDVDLFRNRRGVPGSMSVQQYL